MSQANPPSSIAAAATTVATPLRPREDVLENFHLIEEIVAFLPNVKDCRCALLVNHLWCEALTSLQSFLPASSPTAMTAKDLLSVRLIGDNHETSKKRDLRRLEEVFADKSVKLLLRHDFYGCVASCSIPIHFGENFKQLLDYPHALTIHKRLFVEEYLDGEVIMQLLPDVDFLTCTDYKVDDVVDLKEGCEDSKKLRWYLIPHDLDFLDAKFTGFLHDNFETPHKPSFVLDLTCTYPKDTHNDHADEIVPDVMEGSISISMDEYDISSAFKYLKLMASWWVAFRHMRPISTELSRLRQRFQYTYMLIELEEQSGRQCAFAVVPFADEAGLMALFQTEDTMLQLVDGLGNVPIFHEGRVDKLSILELGSKKRLAKLSKEHIDDKEYFCQLEFLEQTACFEILTLKTKQGLSVQLFVWTTVNESGHEDAQQFATILELYKFLEIVMEAAADRGQGNEQIV